MKKKSYFSNFSIYFIFLCIYYINAQSIVQNETTVSITTSSIRNICEGNPCLNGGTCSNFYIYPFYFCSCLKNYYGQNCNSIFLACVSNPCINNGSCGQRVRSDTYICSCINGFSGSNCQFAPSSPCLPNPCNSGQNCTVLNNGYGCTCKSGFTGENCDINPCENNPCSIYEKCYSSQNVFGTSTYYCKLAASAKYGITFFSIVGIPLLLISLCTSILFIFSRCEIMKRLKKRRRNFTNTSNSTTIRRSTSGQNVYEISSQIDQQQNIYEPNTVSNQNCNDLLDYNNAIRFSVSNEKENFKEEELPTYQETILPKNLS